MARASVIQSSVPGADPEALTDDELLAEDENDDGQIDADDAAAAELEALETEARREGWRPLEEYRGKPGGWVDAKTFIDRGKNFLPFVQKNLNETRQQLEGATKEITGLQKTVEAQSKQLQRLLDYSRQADEAGYKRAVTDLKRQQRDAAAAGDTATFDAVEGQLEQMQSAREESRVDEVEEPTPAAPQPRQPALAPEYVAWLEKNPWFTSNRDLAAAMAEEHNDIIAEAPGMSLADQLDEAKAAVMARFPKKFGIREEEPAPAAPRRPAPPMAPTPPAGQRGTPPGRRTGIDAITDPVERQQAKLGFARAKVSMPNVTEAEYLAIFNDPHADVLEVTRDLKTPSRRA